MSYTAEQIAFMAKVVPGANDLHNWFPWYDWRDLGPLWMACLSWGVRNHATDEIEQPFIDVEKASESGDFDTFATAVCNLAIEIGSTIE